MDIKNRFSNSNEYLAVVTDNGLWIKEEINENIFIIHAEKFDKNKLSSVSITEVDKYYSRKIQLMQDMQIFLQKIGYSMM